MKKIDSIIIHCSDSEWGSAREIRKWHQEKGWKDIGYHFVIGNGKPLPDTEFSSLDGQIEYGRQINDDGFIDDNEIGAHTLGYNGDSVGVCLIGKKTFSLKQMEALKDLLRNLIKTFSVSVDKIRGHCETESGKKEGKTCPNFDVNAFRMYFRGRM